MWLSIPGVSSVQCVMHQRDSFAAVNIKKVTLDVYHIRPYLVEYTGSRQEYVFYAQYPIFSSVYAKNQLR
jgi:hypothetical protein